MFKSLGKEEKGLKHLNLNTGIDRLLMLDYYVTSSTGKKRSGLVTLSIAISICHGAHSRPFCRRVTLSDQTFGQKRTSLSLANNASKPEHTSTYIY